MKILTVRVVTLLLFVGSIAATFLFLWGRLWGGAVSTAVLAVLLGVFTLRDWFKSR